MATATKGKRTLATAIATDGTVTPVLPSIEDIGAESNLNALHAIVVDAQGIIATVDDAVEVREAARARIKSLMMAEGKSEHTWHGKVLLTIRQGTTRKANYKLLEKEYEAAYRACVTESPSVTLEAIK